MARKFARDSGFDLDAPGVSRESGDPDLETPGDGDEDGPRTPYAEALLQAIIRAITTRERLSSQNADPEAIELVDGWILQAGRVYGQITGERPPMIESDVAG